MVLVCCVMGVCCFPGQELETVATDKSPGNDFLHMQHTNEAENLSCSSIILKKSQAFFKCSTNSEGKQLGFINFKPFKQWLQKNLDVVKPSKCCILH